jgi:hypothetical protein
LISGSAISGGGGIACLAPEGACGRAEAWAGAAAWPAVPALPFPDAEAASACEDFASADSGLPMISSSS